VARYGLDASFGHKENGMIKKDMVAASQVADRLNEVIIFRSTGPWSRRWIELGYPTKNFHVKGKSSDWGPQAGFVPYDGYYSKVGSNTKKAAKGTEANNDGISHHFTATTPLTLTEKEIRMQNTDTEEEPPRKAIDSVFPIAGSKDMILLATRTGDNKQHAFRAVFNPGSNAYGIEALDEKWGTNPFKLIDKRGTPLLMMTSSEAGANNRPMTGDYDLMSVCPTWGDYGSRSLKEISKAGVNFTGKGVQPAASFGRGANMDKVLDMTSNTGARPSGGVTNKTFQGLTAREAGRDEHPDMGNLTPRILRCINELNVQMGATGAKSPFRRVHHNAESHRNAIFAALTAAEMEQGEGFPLTVFQPQGALRPASPVAVYQTVSTLETLAEFKAYATLLNQTGYFVPRNWTWGMSIRDR
jgi:hypothetical protein